MVYDWLVDQIQNNQFFSGALGGSVFYSLIGYVKGWTSRIWTPIRNLRVRDISISSYDSAELYNSFNLYLMKRIKNPQNLTIIKSTNAIYYTGKFDSIQTKVKYTSRLSYGTHYYWHNWYTLVYVNVAMEQHHAESKSDIVRATIYSIRAKSIRNEILNEFTNQCAQKDESPKQYKTSEYNNYENGNLIPKDMGAVFIHDSKKQIILDSIKSIEEKKEIYQRAAVNRILGIMLYGKPGTGKTTLIKALAYSLNRSLYYVDFEVPIKRILDTVEKIKPNSILVFEDIDTHQAFRRRESQSTASKDLGIALKLLDGDNLPDDTIIIATTNHIDEIDDAVKRFGRFDVKLEIEEADRDLAEKMIEYLDPSKKYLLDQFSYPISQAEIQARILKI